MTMLNQVIAVVQSKKKLASDAITNAYHLIQKPVLFDGLVKTYTPKDEEGDKLPSESKKAQTTVSKIIAETYNPLIDMFDVVFTQDCNNCEAKADIVIEEVGIAFNVPVTHLLFLEKQLTDIITFVSKLPVLDPAEVWSWDDVTDSYRSEPSDSVRTKKVRKPFVKYEATKEHPAQVDVVEEDVALGTWRTIKFSGAMKASDKAAILERARKLQEAVIKAREQCNAKAIDTYKIGESLLNYVFKGA